MFFRLATLGCKVNQYETELFREGLRRLGYTEAKDGEIADLVFVNTCTVTAESDLKSRKLVRKHIRENTGAKIIAAGCSVSHSPETFAGLQTGNIAAPITLLKDKSQLGVLLEELGLAEIPKGISSFAERHRAYIKIQDGCCNVCSYCIIPKIRPVLASRPENEILDEIKALAKNGYRELVLTGIHLGYYGREQNNDTALVPLLEKIMAVDEPFRLRLSSLEAVEVSDELVDLMLANPQRICPHLHLPMQSGSGSVLRRMKRRWDAAKFVNRCEELKKRFDKLALTTDVIVGFPSETETEFEETCEVVRQLRFSKVHTFRFSARKGTEAADYAGQIPPLVQKQRAERLIQIGGQLRREYAGSLIGTKVSVLLETPDGGTADRYLDVRLSAPQRVGTIVDVVVRQTDDDVLLV